MDFTNGMKKAFLASVGAAATTAEVTKDILEKMIEKGERTVEHGKVLNQELKHNAKQKVKEHVSIQVTKKYDKAFECVDEMSPEDLALLKERIADSGMTVKAICEKSGILRETFYNRLKGGEFTASEIVGLTKTLKLSRSDRDKIFLNEKLN